MEVEYFAVSCASQRQEGQKAHFLCNKVAGPVTIQLIADTFHDRPGTGSHIPALA
jgi:hypothetical protein